MWELLNTPANAPFIVASMILAILLIIELIGFFFGGFSGLLDNMLPDSLVDADFDVDADADMDASSDLSLGLKVLDWLYVGRIPTMILLILLIANFAISGIIIQQMSLSVLGYYLPTWLASIDALVISFPLLRVMASLLYPIMPKDETTAISGSALIGRSASIIIGYASVGQPAQAKVIDEHGQTHYIMVEPDTDNSNQENHLESNSAITTADFETENLTITADDSLIVTQKVGERYLVKKVLN